MKRSIFVFLFLFVFLYLSHENVVNRTRLVELISEREEYVLDICKGLREYYNHPITNCTRIESCDVFWDRKIVAEGGTVSCRPDFGMEEMCNGCNVTNQQTRLSFSLGAVKYAPSLTTTERYDDPEVQKFACSVYDLSPTHNDILQRDPALKWQYISSPSGLITIFPGTVHSSKDITYKNKTYRCKTQDTCQEFEPRERPWYITAASGAKDIILVLDSSSSMLMGGTPNRIELMRKASLTVVNGLGPYDRLSVVYFSNGVWTCSDSLLFVNEPNKEMFKACIDSLTVSTGTNYFKAFEKTFDILSNRTYQHFTCDTVILFLTDGVITSGLQGDSILEYAQDRNIHDISARIFTFTIGDDADVGIAKALACQNRGVWTPIEDGSSGDFHKKMSGYYNYFIYSNYSRGVVWTDQYNDILGLGNLTTATMGCFSHDNVFLGVAGVDVTIDEFTAAGFDFALDVFPELYYRSSVCYNLPMSDEQLEKLRIYSKCLKSEPIVYPDPTDPEDDDDSWWITMFIVASSLVSVSLLCAMVICYCCIGMLFLLLFAGCLICCVCCCVLSVSSSVVCCQFLAITKQKRFLSRYRTVDDDIMDQFLQEQRANTAMDDELEAETATLRINKTLFEIDYKDLAVQKKIGGGGSQAVGVYMCLWQGKKCAFKIFRISDLCSQSDFEQFEREVEILASISHPNVTQFYGACLRNPRVGIVMEFCENGDLKSFLIKYRKKRRIRFPLKTKLEMLLGISSAMKYLHEKKIIHRDLKCENCLVTRHYDTKLVDFGLSKILETILTNIDMTQRIGTSLYMSPEIVKGESYSNKVDVFPFGIMMFEVIADQWNPYGNVPLINLEFKVAVNPSFRPIVEQEVDKFEECRWAIPLMQCCWDDDPLKRPSFKEIFNTFMSHLHVKEIKEQEELKKSMQGEGDNIDFLDRAEIDDGFVTPGNKIKQILIEKI